MAIGDFLPEFGNESSSPWLLEIATDIDKYEATAAMAAARPFDVSEDFAAPVHAVGNGAPDLTTAKLEVESSKLKVQEGCTDAWLNRLEKMTVSDSSSTSFSKVFGYRSEIRRQANQYPKLPDDVIALLRVQPLGSDKLWTRWWAYIEQAPKVLKVEPADLFERAVYADQKGDGAEVYTALRCMNLVRARRMLTKRAFGVFMNHLIHNENSNGNVSAEDSETSRTFWMSLQQSLDFIESKSNYSAIEQKLLPPVSSERFEGL